MTDKLQEQINRGEAAQALLSNELLIEAFEGLKRTYTQVWQTSRVNQTAEREEAFKLFNTISTVQSHLETILANGKMSSKQLQNINKTIDVTNIL